MDLAWRARGRGAAVVIGVVAVDALSKHAASGLDEPVRLIAGAQLRLSHNDGIAFGGLGGLPTGVVVGIVLVALAGLGYFLAREATRAPMTACALVLGGALGNLIDRTRDGAVTDFIDIGAWPSFNLADGAITVGTVWLVWAISRGGGAGEGASSPASRRALRAGARR